MGSDWKVTTLDSIAFFKNGKVLNSSFYIDNGKHPVWGANGQIARTNMVLNDHPVVVIGRVGAYCGSVHAVHEPNWVTDNAITATAKPGNDVLFLYYLLKSLKLEHSAIGSAQPLVTQSGLKIISCYVPPFPEQRAIAHILGALDDKIELNRRMNETLEAMALAIFKSWFVDFAPVHAKAEGRDPGLPKEIADLFPDSFEDSELGMIPKGWEVLPLHRIASLIAKTVYPNTEPKKTWTHYSIPAFDEGKRAVLQTGEDIKSGKYIVPYNSVLASKLNPQFPRVWLPDVEEHDVAICSTEFMPFVPMNDNWRSFLYELMKSQAVQDAIIGRVTGSTGSRQRVKPKEISALPIIKPPDTLIDTYCSMVGCFHKKKLANIRASCSLVSVRDTLIPKLISGKIRVKGCGEI